MFQRKIEEYGPSSYANCQMQRATHTEGSMKGQPAICDNPSEVNSRTQKEVR